MREQRVFVGVRLSPAGLKQLQDLVDASGKTLSDVIRTALKHGLPAAQRELTR